MARKIVIGLGVLLLVLGGLTWWRAAHPPLTDEQQILANLEGLRTSAVRGSVDGVMNYLGDDFKWNGETRSTVRSMLFGAFYEGLHKRDIAMSFTALQTTVTGETATVTGHFKVDQHANFGTINSTDGDFSTTWTKRDGNWKISTASGGENITQ